MKTIRGELELKAMKRSCCGHQRDPLGLVPSSSERLCGSCWEERRQDLQDNFAKKLTSEMQDGLARGEKVAARIPFIGMPSLEQDVVAVEHLWVRVLVVPTNDDHFATGALWNRPTLLSGGCKGDVLPVPLESIDALRIGETRYYGECQVEKRARALSDGTVAP